MRNVDRTDECRGSGDHATVDQLDSGESIVLDRQSRDRTVDHVNAAHFELGAFSLGDIVGVGEEDDVVGPLPHELGVLHRVGMRTEYPEGLVAHFPPVAVRTVQKIPAPTTNAVSPNGTTADLDVAYAVDKLTTAQFDDATAVNRWKPLYKWFLAIPHYVVYVGLAVASVFTVLGGAVAVVITGEYPHGARAFLVGTYRYGLRIEAYVGLLTDEYPPFSLAA